MEFRKNLESIREDAREQEPERRLPQTTMKVEINNLLFQLMPPGTTLIELEHLALALLQTIESAWDQSPAALAPSEDRR